jgi:hypothetical protein
MRIAPSVLAVCVLLTGACGERKSDATATEIQTYLRENFGMPGYETSWYGGIKSVRIDGDAVVAEVSPATLAPGVCAAVSSYVYDRTRSHGLRSIRIEDPARRVLIHRRSLADPCR